MTNMQFVVTPNFSMSWKANQTLIISLAVLSFGMALAFAAQGLWMILPFVGLEITALTAGLYWCCLKATRREVISIDADYITVAAGRDHAVQTTQFQTAWTKIMLHPSRVTGHPGQLVLRSKGKELEVGAFLSQDERLELSTSIRSALSNVVYS